MYLRDGLTLAAAKLKVRPIRTGIVVFIVALLFAGIALVAFVFAGMVTSLRGFSNEGLSNRFIVQGRPLTDDLYTFATKDRALLEEMRTKTAGIIAEKKAAAKRLGITYDPLLDTNLPTFKGGPSGANEGTINSMSPFVQEAITQKFAAMKGIQYDDFRALATKSGAEQTYKSTYYDMYSGGSMMFSDSERYFQPIKNGKEAPSQNQMGGFGPTGFDTLLSYGWSYFDEELLQPFLLPGQHLAVGKDGSVPVIAPMSVAEAILSKEKLPATATSKERLAHLVGVRTEIAGKTTQLCYRNSTSSQLLQMARDQEREIAANKSKRDYIAPSLQYAVPTVPCGAVAVKKDTRNAEEKKAAANELTFKRAYEGYKDPQQEIVTLRIVGLVPDMNYEFGMSVRALATAVLQSSLGNGWYSPIKAVSGNEVINRVSPLYDRSIVSSKSYYAEFSSLAQAREFVRNNTCNIKQDIGSTPWEKGERVSKCAENGKYFDLKPFGSNASAIEDLRQNTWKVMKYVVMVVMVLTSLVLMGIVGKIIADSRRETAVFRALGASRMNIAHIYLVYTFFLSVGVAIVALGLGAAGALILSNKYSQDISTAAVLAYNAADVHKRFVLFGVDPLLLVGITGIILFAALMSAVIPLAANIQRNPIRDMRDEN